MDNKGFTGDEKTPPTTIAQVHTVAAPEVKQSALSSRDMTSSKTNIVSSMEKDPDAIDIEEDFSKSRETWGGQLEFILTCVGYAVGLGNVWRFPYLCYKNGGGAFLIPYVIMLCLVGLPLFYLELAFGQFASLGPLTIWTINPMMKGLGYAMVIVNTMIALYYNVIIAWSIYYFFSSMTTELPWTYCNNWWNSDQCFTNEFIQNNCTGNTTIHCTDGRMINRSDIKTPSQEYFYDQVLQISGGIEELGGVRWQLACCLLMSWTIVFFVLIKGISSLGKVVYFSSIFPYILLSIMLIRGVTLPGASLGIEYYLRPDFSKLSDAQVWSDAATQIFYSLSACTGGLIAMSSFNKFDNNCLRDSLLVPFINCGTSIFAGFVIFSVLGFMATEKGVSVDEVAESGPGLVFVVYPEGLTQMPAPPVWAVLFFFMLITLGFSSEFSMVECFFSSFVDEFPSLRKSRTRNITFRAIGIIVAFFVTLPMVCEGGFYLFNLVDVMVSGFPLLFVGFFESIAIAHIYGYSTFAEDIAMMLGSRPGLFWRITWCLVTPLILIGVILFMAVQYQPPTLFETYEYPMWAMGIGWIVVLFPLLFIPAFFFYTLLADGGLEIIKRDSKPLPVWGPANPMDRMGRYAILDKVGKESNVLEASFTRFTGQTCEAKPTSVYSLPAYNEVSSRLGTESGTACSTFKQVPNGNTNEPTTHL